MSGQLSQLTSLTAVITTTAESFSHNNYFHFVKKILSIHDNFCRFVPVTCYRPDTVKMCQCYLNSHKYGRFVVDRIAVLCCSVRDTVRIYAITGSSPGTSQFKS